MDLITVEEVSNTLGYSPQYIRNLLRTGRIPGQKVGKQWLVDKSAYEIGFSIEEPKPSYKVTVPDRKSSLKNSPPIKALSFFSGAMGLDIGLHKAGIDVLLASEIDNSSRKTIITNNPHIGLIGDIQKYTPEEILEYANLTKSDDIDLIVGGPPCQAFSTAGKRKSFEDDRGNVFLTYLEIIKELRPKYAVIENVRGLLSAPLKHRPHSERGESYSPLTIDESHGGALNHILKFLESLGYGVSFNLYNAANFGAPQKRERMIIVCSRDGKTPPYLEPTHSENGFYELPKWRTLREVIKDLDPNEATHLKFPEKRIKYYKLLSEGQNWRALPEHLQKEALGRSYYSQGGRTGFLRRLAWDKPSPTLVTHPAMPATDLAHPEYNRPLSIEEYKKIQEFPDHWEICGSLLDKYKQIGNAVPVSLGHAVGRHIIKLLNGESIKDYKEFKYSRYRETDEKSFKEKVNKIAKKQLVMTF